MKDAVLEVCECGGTRPVGGGCSNQALTSGVEEGETLYKVRRWLAVQAYQADTGDIVYDYVPWVGCWPSII